MFKSKHKDNLLFQLGYISLKYTYYPKFFFIIYSIFELIITITLISISIEDKSSKVFDKYLDIIYSTMQEYDNQNKELPFYLHNFSTYIGIIFIILSIITRMSRLLFIVIIVILNVIIVIKIAQALLLIFYNKGDLINPTFKTKLFYYFCSFIDLFYKTLGEILFYNTIFNSFDCYYKSNSVNKLGTNFSSYTYLHSKYECYSYINVSIIIILVIDLIINVLLSVYYSIFFSYCNLFTNNNFGVFSHYKKDVFSTLGKILLPLLFHVNYNNKSDYIKLIVFTCCMLLSLYYTYKEIYKTKNFYVSFTISKESFLLFYSIFFTIKTSVLFKIDLLLFVIVMIVCFILSIIVLILFYKLKEKSFNEFKSNSLYSLYSMIYMLDLILKEGKSNYENTKLKGLVNMLFIEGNYENNNLIKGLFDEINLIYNYDNSKNNNNNNNNYNNFNYSDNIHKYTNVIMNSNNSELELNKSKNTIQNFFFYDKFILNNNLICCSNNKDKDILNKDNLLSKYIELWKFIINSNFNEHSSSSTNYKVIFKFNIILTQVLVRHLNNYIKAISNLSFISINKLNTFEKFELFCLSKEINEKLIEKDKQTKEANNVDFEEIIKLEHLINKFWSSTESVTKLLKNFWIDIYENSKKLSFKHNIVRRTLKEIHDKNMLIREKFYTILMKYGDNPKLMYGYSYFLKNTIRNEIIYDDIQLRFENILDKTYVINNKELISLNSNNINNEFNNNNKGNLVKNTIFEKDTLYKKGLMFITADKSELGKIKWANQAVSEILGYTIKDLCNSKINNYLPYTISCKHDNYLKNFVSSSKELFLNNNRTVIFINSSNFIVVTQFYGKVLPSVRYGISIGALIYLSNESSFSCNSLMYKSKKLYSGNLNNENILYNNTSLPKTNNIHNTENDINIVNSNKIHNNKKVYDVYKSCLILFNSSGLIEAIDSNTNTLIGIPSFFKTGIVIDNKLNLKNNIFKLCPSLKESILNNQFSSYTYINSSIFEEEFLNEENSLFLDINSKFNKVFYYLKSQLLNIKDKKSQELILNYYQESENEDFPEPKESNILKGSNYKLAKSLVVNLIFRNRRVNYDLFYLNSSYKDLDLYVMKIYFKCGDFKDIISNDLTINKVVINGIVKKKTIVNTKFYNKMYSSNNKNVSDKTSLFFKNFLLPIIRKYNKTKHNSNNSFIDFKETNQTLKNTTVKHEDKIFISNKKLKEINNNNNIIKNIKTAVNSTINNNINISNTFNKDVSPKKDILFNRTVTVINSNNKLMISPTVTYTMKEINIFDNNNNNNIFNENINNKDDNNNNNNNNNNIKKNKNLDNSEDTIDYLEKRSLRKLPSISKIRKNSIKKARDSIKKMQYKKKYNIKNLKIESIKNIYYEIGIKSKDLKDNNSIKKSNFDLVLKNINQDKKFYNSKDIKKKNNNNNNNNNSFISNKSYNTKNNINKEINKNNFDLSLKNTESNIDTNIDYFNIRRYKSKWLNKRSNKINMQKKYLLFSMPLSFILSIACIIFSIIYLSNYVNFVKNSRNIYSYLIERKLMLSTILYNLIWNVGLSNNFFYLYKNLTYNINSKDVFHLLIEDTYTQKNILANLEKNLINSNLKEHINFRVKYYELNCRDCSEPPTSKIAYDAINPINLLINKENLEEFKIENNVYFTLESLLENNEYFYYLYFSYNTVYHKILNELDILFKLAKTPIFNSNIKNLNDYTKLNINIKDYFTNYFVNTFYQINANGLNLAFSNYKSYFNEIESEVYDNMQFYNKLLLSTSIIAAVVCLLSTSIFLYQIFILSKNESYIYKSLANFKYDIINIIVTGYDEFLSLIIKSQSDMDDCLFYYCKILIII